jgi:hypothetical protein
MKKTNVGLISSGSCSYPMLSVAIDSVATQEHSDIIMSGICVSPCEMGVEF